MEFQKWSNSASNLGMSFSCLNVCIILTLYFCFVIFSVKRYYCYCLTFLPQWVIRYSGFLCSHYVPNLETFPLNCLFHWLPNSLRSSFLDLSLHITKIVACSVLSHFLIFCPYFWLKLKFVNSTLGIKSFLLLSIAIFYVFLSSFMLL